MPDAVLANTIDEIRTYVSSARTKGQTVGFVPTMGFLHAGHISLARIAREQQKCDVVIMSVFVNPTQFGPNEDYDKYPRDLERDRALVRDYADVLFTPSVTDMYPPGATTYVDVGPMGSVMCGATRPGHFRGVTTVVAKLLNIVQPDVAVFGQKDAQQFLILNKMVRDLDSPVRLVMAPIVREADGLAMSSRNIYLSADERQQALCLSQSLEIAKKMVSGGTTDTRVIVDAMRNHIEKNSLARIDYVTIRETASLQEIDILQKPSLIAVAVFIGKTRLIDNWIFA